MKAVILILCIAITTSLLEGKKLTEAERQLKAQEQNRKAHQAWINLYKPVKQNANPADPAQSSPAVVTPGTTQAQLNTTKQQTSNSANNFVSQNSSQNSGQVNPQTATQNKQSSAQTTTQNAAQTTQNLAQQAAKTNTAGATNTASASSQTPAAQAPASTNTSPASPGAAAVPVPKKNSKEEEQKKAKYVNMSKFMEVSWKKLVQRVIIIIIKARVRSFLSNFYFFTKW